MSVEQIQPTIHSVPPTPLCKTEKEFTNLVSETIHSNYLTVGYG